MSKEHQRVNVSILGLIAISNNKKKFLNGQGFILFMQIIHFFN